MQFILHIVSIFFMYMSVICGIVAFAVLKNVKDDTTKDTYYEFFKQAERIFMTGQQMFLLYFLYNYIKLDINKQTVYEKIRTESSNSFVNIDFDKEE